MALQRIGDRIRYYPHQSRTDRPLLAYLKGDRLALAVDAGNSAKHVDEFYAALDQEGLKPPDLTAITHWHWDHTFGMHRTSGLTIAHRRTREMIEQAGAKLAKPGAVEFLKRSERHVALEYGEDPLVVTLPDIVFEREVSIDLGGMTARVFHVESPHTDDAVFVHVPEEGVLFLGDATSGDPFDGWQVDARRMRALISALEDVACDTCVLGHAEPLAKAELLDYLASQLD